MKFDGSKDLANKDHLLEFEKLNYKRKLVLVNKPIKDLKYVLYIENWEFNGAKMFLKSLKEFDVFLFLKNKGIKKGPLTYVVYYLYKKISH